MLDAAGPFIISTDTVVEGVHFNRSWLSPWEIGWRGAMAAWSDIAAGRGQPFAALVAISLPSKDWLDPKDTDAVMAGVRSACEQLGATLVGGDTTRTPGPLTLTLTVLGSGSRPLTRTGACPGDLLQISGPCGWAAWAVHCFQRGITPPERAALAWRRPRARLDLLPALAAAHACIDVSDGLLADAAHLAGSSGCALEFDREALRDDALSSVAGDLAEHCTLRGGDDYELLVAAPVPLPGFSTIGRVKAGAGLWFDNGTRADLGPLGWDHGGAS